MAKKVKNLTVMSNEDLMQYVYIRWLLLVGSEVYEEFRRAGNELKGRGVQMAFTEDKFTAVSK